ncbi:T9SS-dependent choice-of-anchor J family protein [Flavobacterium wongokense]|uniref:T9SS-dependent choice-of-anchor J family protein n=1 Tax=Flavobacterium wongokense TaxID=2910674 RepID=UPI001F40CFD0|nr:T9SS type A sorting domain-containing protein [Flavobacterium sp. WG47]MCF6132788.1 T9SS type A sorting domain-containing protein [Flavobacterium sp. WG47]
MKKLLLLSLLIANQFEAQSQAANVPYSYGFENFTEGWDIVNLGTGTATWFFWENGDNGVTSAEGNNYAGYFFSDTDANSWILSRKINMSAGITYAISFQYRGQVPEYTECLKVTIGNNNTVAAQIAGTLLFENNQIQSDQWVTKTVYYTPAASGNYALGFNVCSIAWQALLAVDDIRINIATLSNEDYATPQFSVAPNPVNNLLTIENPHGLLIGKINISDNLGRIMKQIVNQSSTSVVLDIANVPAGMYILLIETENGITRKKIIKE